MEIFWILDLDPHNNRCGSATLINTFTSIVAQLEYFAADPDPTQCSVSVSALWLHVSWIWICINDADPDPEGKKTLKDEKKTIIHPGSGKIELYLEDQAK